MIDTRIAKSGIASTYTLPTLEITDEPRFAWRGLMLDEARHFFGKVTVMKLIDTMAYLKLNRLHWHLTDDYWRYEIKAYPRLTSVGSVGQLSAPDAPALFYTQEDSSADRLQEMIAKGYEVILCNESPTYFSRIQANGLHYGRGPVTPVEQVYRHPDPLASKVPDLDKAAGLQAALWTETVHTPERLWFQLFPRLTALAESSWTPAARKDYTDFTHRLPVHFTYLRSQGIYLISHDPRTHPCAAP